jgi:uncharacterized membrane protein
VLIAYWIVAGLLAVFYLYSGGIKVFRSRDALRPMMHWVDDMPLGIVRAIGVAEVLGAIGLILPPLVGVLPWLALVAAIGLFVVQIGAVIVHRRRREAVWLNVALLVLTAVVVWLATIWL